MSGFLLNTASAALGFLIMKLATAFFDARISHTRFIEDERTQDVERIIQRIDELVGWGSEYWGRDASGDDGPLAQKITAKMHDVGGICSELFADYPNSASAVDMDLRRFEDHLTGGNFGVSDRKADVLVIGAASKAGTSLQLQVRRQRRKMRPVWW